MAQEVDSAINSDSLLKGGIPRGRVKLGTMLNWDFGMRAGGVLQEKSIEVDDSE